MHSRSNLNGLEARRLRDPLGFDHRDALAEQIYQFTRHNSCLSRATIAYPQTCTVVVWCRMRSSIAAVIQCAINAIYKPPPEAANACCAQQG